MSNITGSGNNNNNNPVDLLNHIKYIILFTCYVPSIICCTFTLPHFLTNRNLRNALHHHITLVLLIIATFDLLLNHPFTLNYLRMSRVIPPSNTICLFWNFVNSLFTIDTFLTMAWSSFERHLFIFYPSLFMTRRGRILFHYIPLLSITLLYPIISHIIIYLLYPCVNQFNMLSLFCGYTCALKVPSIALYARLMHNFIPTMIVAGSTLTLVLRVVKRKQQIQNNRLIWRRCRRMLIQLLALVTLFFLLTLPATIVSIVQNCCLPTFAATIQTLYLNFLVRFLTIFMPFICLSLLPEIRSKLLKCKRTRICPPVSIQPRPNLIP